jgi:hypothetical protein
MFLSKMLRAVDHPYIVGPGGRKVRANSEEFHLCLIESSYLIIFCSFAWVPEDFFAEGKKTLPKHPNYD